MKKVNQYQLDIKAHNQLGTLERILRVIRHRGGRIESMDMQTDHANMMELSIKLTTEKSIEMLQSQVAKLVDVIAANSSAVIIESL